MAVLEAELEMLMVVSLLGLISCFLGKLERHQVQMRFPEYKHMFTP